MSGVDLQDDHQIVYVAKRLEQLADMLRKREARPESVERSYDEDRAEYFGGLGAMSLRCSSGREHSTVRIRIGSDEEQSLRRQVEHLSRLVRAMAGDC